MKVIFSIIALTSMLAFVPASLAHAKTCGIGNRIWEGQTGTGAKLFQLTTNFWTFKAISTTFGIAGCERGQKLVSDAPDEKVLHFASNNLDRLARDMSRGSGEHLDALAVLMHVRVEDQAAFRSFAQRNFVFLFPHDDVTVGEVLVALDRLIAQDETLSVYAKS